jgi:hypothetical protein
MYEYIDHTQFRLKKQAVNKIFHSFVSDFFFAVVSQICVALSPRKTDKNVNACVHDTHCAGNVLSGERTFTKKKLLKNESCVVF